MSLVRDAHGTGWKEARAWLDLDVATACGTLYVSEDLFEHVRRNWNRAWALVKGLAQNPWPKGEGKGKG